jgi:hypothetical protein
MIGRACSTNWERGIRKSEGKRPVGRPRHTREAKINIDLKTDCGGMDWIDLAREGGDNVEIL